MASAAEAATDLLDELPELITYLRAFDFGLSVEDELRIATLTSEIQCRGGAALDVASLEEILAPVVCRNPDDQERLPQILERWRKIHVAQPDAAPADERRSDGAAARTPDRTIWIVLGVGLALIVVILAVLSFGLAGGEGTGGGGNRPGLGGGGPGAVAPVAATALPAWQIYALAALPPIAAFLIFLRRRRSAAMSRGRTPRDAASRALDIDVAGSPLFRPGAIQIALHDLRRHRQVASSELDIPRTVAATARCAGFVQFVFGRRNVLPDHLLLADRASGGDHFGELAKVLGARLRADQFRAARGEYFGDPSRVVLIGDDGRRRHRELSRLVADQPDLRLLLFADVADFWDPVRERWRDWVALLERFETVAVLTPIPRAQWGAREHALANRDFLIVPATSEGLASLAEQLRQDQPAERASRGSGGTDLLDSLIGSELYRWSDDVPPAAERIAALMKALRETLDEDAFLHLAAIAVFPTVNPRLTEQVGALLIGANGAPVLTEERYGALARLPWLRQARIPDWLRKALIEAIPAGDAERVRALWVELLAKAPASTDKGLSIDVVGERPEQLAVRRLLRMLSSDQELDFAEHILLAFLGNRKLPDLAVEAPGRLTRLGRLPKPDWIDGAMAVTAALFSVGWLLSGDAALEALASVAAWASGLPASIWSAAALAALSGLAYAVYVRPERLFWLIHLEASPWFRFQRRWSRLAKPSTAEADRRLNLLFRIYRVFNPDILSEKEFLDARRYLEWAQDEDARPAWPWPAVFLALMAMAQISALSYFLGIFPFRRLIGDSVIAIVVSTLFAVPPLLIAYAAGRSFKRTRTIRRARLEIHETLDLAGLAPPPGTDPVNLLFMRVSLGDEDGGGRAQRVLNRVALSHDERGSYVLPVLWAAVLVASVVLQVGFQAISDTVVSFADVGRFGDWAISAAASNWLFVIVLVLTGLAAFALGHRCGFMGRDSARAYRMTRGWHSYDEFAAGYRSRVRRIDDSLDLLRAAIRRRYPGIEPSSAGFLARIGKSAGPAAAGPESRSGTASSAAPPAEPAPGETLASRLRLALPDLGARASIALLAYFPALVIWLDLVDVPAAMAALAKTLSFSVATLLAGLFLLSRRVRQAGRRRLVLIAAVSAMLGAATATFYVSFAGQHLVRTVDPAYPGRTIEYVLPLAPSPELQRIAEAYGGDLGAALETSADRARMEALLARENRTTIAILLALLAAAQAFLSAALLCAASALVAAPGSGPVQASSPRSVGGSEARSAWDEGTEGRVLGSAGLFALGLGSIIGTGILFIHGSLAQLAGPSLILSLALAGGLNCAVAACYAHLSRRFPSSGSLYTFASIAFSERIGWLAGWCLIGQTIVTAALVSIGWSGYMLSYVLPLLGAEGVPWWAASYDSGGVVNLPATALCLGVAVLLAASTRLALGLNIMLVALKVVALLAFVAMALPGMQAENFQPFLPRGLVDQGWFGAGMLGAACSAFYLFVGYEVIATAADDAHAPERQVPLALQRSTWIATIITFAVGLGVVGILGAQPILLADGSLAATGSQQMAEACGPLPASTTACVVQPIATALGARGMESYGQAIVLATALALPTMVIGYLFAAGRLMRAMASDRLRSGNASNAAWTVIGGVVAGLVVGFLPSAWLGDALNAFLLLPIVIVALTTFVLGRRSISESLISGSFALKISVPLILLSGAVLAPLIPATSWVILGSWLALGGAIHFSISARARPVEA